jgi:hypothetical protein
MSFFVLLERKMLEFLTFLVAYIKILDFAGSDMHRKIYGGSC